MAAKRKATVKKRSQRATKSKAAAAGTRRSGTRTSRQKGQPEALPPVSSLTPERRERLRRLLRSPEVQDFLDTPGVTSVGLGYKREDGRLVRRKGEPVVAIQFTVENKAAPEELESLGAAPIPSSFEIDGETIETDVVERSFEPSYRIVAEQAPEDRSHQRRTRRDPILPGISVAHAKRSAGTVGAIVFDRASGAAYVLSNWHVLHGAEGRIGDDVVQPGPFDDNRNVSGNRIGRLVRSHLGLAGDCAIASIETRGYDAKIFELDVAPRRLADPELGDRVVKSGRTTGVTHGIVSRVDVTARISYRDHGPEKIGAFEIAPDPAHPAERGEISERGDSGSLWMVNGADGDVAIGLHFAGETDPDPAREYALASPLRTVLRKLEVALEAPAAVAKPAVAAAVAIAPAPVPPRPAREDDITARASLSLEEVQRIKAELWSEDADAALEDADESRRIVAEGDSWFDYPPGLTILDYLKKLHGWQIYPVAEAGDTLENMIYGTEIDRSFRRRRLAIDETLAAIEKHRPRVFLFSGGGNDIAGEEFGSFLNHKSSGEPALRRDYAEYMIDVVFAKAYRHLFAKVWEKSPDVKIVIHGYAQAIPDGRGVLNFPFGFRFFGPWLRPALAAKGWSVAEGTPVVAEMIDRFNAMLAQCAAESGGRVHHLDLRPHVGRDDWANELHLYNRACARLAGMFDAKLRELAGP